MKFLLLPALCVSLGLLSACGKDEAKPTAPYTAASVDSDGNCTSLFVSDYNDVVNKGKTLVRYLKSGLYSQAELTAQAQVVRSACLQFQSIHGTVSCMGEVRFQLKSASWSDLKPLCDEVDKSLGL